MKISGISIQKVNRPGYRFEGEFYLNDNSLLSMRVEDYTNSLLLQDVAEVFNPPVFKRQFCQKSTRAIPYYQSSDVQNAYERSTTYVFGKQAEKLNLLVRTGDILVTGFGTIGNVRLVNAHQDGVCYANNVCRVRVNSTTPTGLIYAFLSSKYGRAQLNKNASGSVVRYIESPGIKKTIIPDFPKEFQEKVDGMIKRSARLREEAADALDTVHKIFDEEVALKTESIASAVNVQEIFSGRGKRFEASIYRDSAKSLINAIERLFDFKEVHDLTLNIYTEGIFKREYVPLGFPFLMGSDILRAIPTASKYISHRQAANKTELFVKPGWILMTCSGSVGDVVYVDKHLASFIYTHDLIRIVPKDERTQLYLFGFLSSSVGKKLVNHYKYGSVIQHLEAFHVSDIPVPILHDFYDEIIENVQKYVSAIEQSKQLELDAIAMVEAEIEKWSHPHKHNNDN